MIEIELSTLKYVRIRAPWDRTFRSEMTGHGHESRSGLGCDNFQTLDSDTDLDMDKILNLNDTDIVAEVRVEPAV